MKLAHLSDIHFWHFSKCPVQFFSKRWIANFHGFFTRRKLHNPQLAYPAIEKMKELGVTHLIISGDFTTSSSKKEFAMTEEFLLHVKDLGLEVLCIPGNHDSYTKKDYKNQTFYKTLAPYVAFNTLPEKRVAAFPLTSGWQLVLIDCAIPTPLGKAFGLFSEEIEAHLRELLASLPKEDSLIICCHFPFDSYKRPFAHLERGEHLEALLRSHSNVSLYLHGHRHKFRAEPLSLFTIDSGSISLNANSTFVILELQRGSHRISPFWHNGSSWEPLDV